MRLNPRNHDTHPARCDCGLCEPVERMTWRVLAEHVATGLLFVAVTAALLFFLGVQVVIQ